MKFSKERFRSGYSKLRNSRWFRNSTAFFGFVVLAFLFWCVMALNDSFQESIEVHLNISNAPDSVTFITVPPTAIHVSVQDKGTSLMRVGVFKHPVVNLNFRDFAEDGIFKVSRSNFQAALKALFGPNAVIASSSIDSLSLIYTTAKGRRVPVEVSYDCTAASGYTIAQAPKSAPPTVVVYTAANFPDTVSKVFTEKIIRRNLSEPISVSTRIEHIHGVRCVPDLVSVDIPVEPLVRKQSQVVINVVNVPEGSELLLFPQKARVAYYVPMSRFGDTDHGIVVTADFNDIARAQGSKIPLRVERHPQYVFNSELIDQSVEYTVVKD
ncbi:MAG: hypothetical protein NC097_00280 [Clostridium sp.]|nr:hypothetical protein [Prevotella sp.]MCM1428218.1 hypothetical protein [Clostridium sp.]MCM1475948.1 hypothetical protein [Muribaculaceae bacterium]